MKRTYLVFKVFRHTTCSDRVPESSSSGIAAAPAQVSTEQQLRLLLLHQFPRQFARTMRTTCRKSQEVVATGNQKDRLL